MLSKVNREGILLINPNRAGHTDDACKCVIMFVKLKSKPDAQTRTSLMAVMTSTVRLMGSQCVSCRLLRGWIVGQIRVSISRMGCSNRQQSQHHRMDPELSRLLTGHADFLNCGSWVVVHGGEVM